MLRSKKYYLDEYVKLWKNDREQYFMKNGDIKDWCFSESEHDMTADQIVGYYIAYYENEELETWEYNLECSKCKWGTDEEVTKILKQLDKINKIKSFISKNIKMNK